jgi:hypothetical protein
VTGTAKAIEPKNQGNERMSKIVAITSMSLDGYVAGVTHLSYPVHKA